jgi:uncharacterized RDD family membrane protein YckC
MNSKQTNPTVTPILLKLGAAILYETLTILALSFVFSGLFLWLIGDATHGIKRIMLQLFLWFAVGVYFVLCWIKTGQTLALQAWQLKLVTQETTLLSINNAMIRYLLASLGLMFFGLGFLWAIVDRDKLFLHDRLLKNKIIVTKNKVPLK